MLIGAGGPTCHVEEWRTGRMRWQEEIWGGDTSNNMYCNFSVYEETGILNRHRVCRSAVRVRLQCTARSMSEALRKRGLEGFFSPQNHSKAFRDSRRMKWAVGFRTLQVTFDAFLLQPLLSWVTWYSANAAPFVPKLLISCKFCRTLA